jgi:hypothetical protein
MVISYKYKYIFVGLPYSGSSAITKELIEWYEGEFILKKHSNIQHLLKVQKIDLKDYFVFGVYRDPKQILISRYNKLLNNPDNRFSDPKFSKNRGGYVSDKAIKMSYQLRNEGISYQKFLAQKFKIFKFITIPYVNQFPVNAPYFNYVIRFKYLNEDFVEALKRIGIEKASRLKVLNRTNKDMQDYTIDNDLKLKVFDPFYKYCAKFTDISESPKPDLFSYYLFCILLPLKKRRLLKEDCRKVTEVEKLLAENNWQFPKPKA